MAEKEISHTLIEFWRESTVNLCKTVTLKKTENCFLRPINA